MNEHSRRGDDVTLSAACTEQSNVSEWGRFVVAALKDVVVELRKDREAGISRYVNFELSWSDKYQRGVDGRLASAIWGADSALREGEESRIARLVLT